MNRLRTLKFKRLLPVVPLVLGFVAVAAAAHSTPTPQADSVHGASTANTSSATSSPSSQPDVTVNGQKVVTGPHGTANLSLPGGGNAQVEVSGGNTTITTNSASTGSSANANGGTMNVTIDSESNSGSGSSHTTVLGSSTNTTNNGSFHSFTSSHVFSTGPAHVEVNNP